MGADGLGVHKCGQKTEWKMNESPVVRELNTPTVGWVPVSLDFGRDEAFADIEDESITLAAAGLMVAALAACLSKDEDWISRNEVLRSLIPGTKESKLEAAAALCLVGLWAPENRGGREGWIVGVSSALAAKRERFEHASNAAKVRYRKSREKSLTQRAIEEIEADNPF
jgi:hypothetical protein